MAGPFRVLTTPAFEREFRAISKKDSTLIRALEELIEILSNDPQNRSGRYKIKKLAGLKPGEGHAAARPACRDARPAAHRPPDRRRSPQGARREHVQLHLGQPRHVLSIGGRVPAVDP